MGGSESKSKAKQTVKNNIINKSILDVLNRTIIDTIVDVTVENVKQCSASLIQRQNIKFGNLRAKGPININTSQTMDGMLNFACVQKDTVVNDIVNSIISQVMGEINSKIDNQSINDLDAKANSKATNDWLSTFGKSKSNSEVDQKIENDIQNISERTLKNVVEFSTKINFTNKNLSTCLAKVVALQNFEVGNVTSTESSITFTNDQKMAVQVYAQCVQSSNVSNKIVQDMTNFLGLTIKDDTRTGLNNTVVGESIATALSNGPLGSIGTLFSNMFGPLTDLLSSLTGFPQVAAGSLCTISSFVSSFIIFICIIIILIKMFY